MGRVYRVSFKEVSVSAEQDFVQITGPASGSLILIRRQWVFPAHTAIISGQSFALESRYLPATVTIGSGGTTGITPDKLDPGDATAGTTTCATNNTTEASTNGTAVVLYEGGCHYYQGHEHIFATPPVIANGTAFVFSLVSTPSAAVVLSGGVEFEELG